MWTPSWCYFNLTRTKIMWSPSSFLLLPRLGERALVIAPESWMEPDMSRVSHTRSRWWSERQRGGPTTALQPFQSEKKCKVKVIDAFQSGVLTFWSGGRKKKTLHFPQCLWFSYQFLLLQIKFRVGRIQHTAKFHLIILNQLKDTITWNDIHY